MLNDRYQGVALGVECAWPTASGLNLTPGSAIDDRLAIVEAPTDASISPDSAQA